MTIGALSQFNIFDIKNTDMKTALSPRRLTHSLSSVDMPVSEPSAAPALAAQLWNKSQDLAHAALESDYIQGIKNGTLDPNYYGQYSVQDVSYCYHGLDDWRTAAARATHPKVKAFAEVRVKSWSKYVQETYSAWHIQDPSAVALSAATKAYVEVESDVAQNFESIYTVVIMTPCDRLWSWLAKQLETNAVPTNLYSFWVKENLNDSGALHLENTIDANASLLDEEKALKIFRRAMLGEVNCFRSACGQEPLNESSK